MRASGCVLPAAGWSRGCRCYWQCPALEECRNLISTFSETGFSGCANTNMLPAVLSRPSTVQQNPPQNPNAEAKDSQFTLILSCQHSPLCHRFPQVPRNRWVARYGSWGVSEPLLRMDVSWWDPKVSHPGCGTQRGILACTLTESE